MYALIHDMNEIRSHLENFDFESLFIEELGWDRFRAKHSIEADGRRFELEGVATKSGVVVLACRPATDDEFPGTALRRRIDREVSKLHQEHVILFVDRDRTRQIWSIPERHEGKTVRLSQLTYYRGKGIEYFVRRIQQLAYSIDQAVVPIAEVRQKVSDALLADKVTKKFFKEFSDQRKGFVKFLNWIEDESKRDWYCSVLLNRLMFIYFLGGKGFLPGGTAFLTNNLAKNIKDNGADTFYTHFLLPLSFFGLGEQQNSRGRFEETFKDVLYLDGGLFTVHQVERELGLNKDAVANGVFPAEAKIPDAEFKRWFDYFDKWRWTLDEDKVENDGYISPHILGYIFEKYINQKQMGAYYTKEDITGYICRNTIIPRLFDMLAETGTKGKQAAQPLPIGPHPNLLNEGRGISDGEGIDRYVYPSVKQDDKLPTETDYEQAQRRKRYEGILTDFDGGKIAGIDDFITYNLDIERLALDFVRNIQDPEVLHAFYFRGLQQITVLDPTCGSGAFLFAALNILYPLYNAALSRMRYLVGKATGSEPDVVNWAGRLHFDDLEIDGSTFVDLVPAGGVASPALDDLRAEVERINDHPSAEYFIKKSIIVNNLFGVDIMEEAVEICKLRLFLTLIATVERDDSKDNFGVEPLPDIDFNILAGNTLVGYTSIADIDRLWHVVEAGTSTKSGTMPFDKDHSRLEKLIKEYGKVLKAWRLQQLGEWRGATVSKEQVLRAVEEVRPDLDEDIWRLYRTAGLALQEVKSASGSGKAVELTQSAFKSSHEPFHWLLEFPDIEASGGFDVVIGNPPYLSGNKLKGRYSTIGLVSEGCNDLYAWTMERSIALKRRDATMGFIVPISSICSRGFSKLRTAVYEAHGRLWVFNYANRPGQLFTGAQNRLTIIIAKSLAGLDYNPRNQPSLFVSKYRRWYGEERPSMFDTLGAIRSNQDLNGLSPLFKFDRNEHASIISKVQNCHKKLSAVRVTQSEHFIFYQESVGYWVKASLGLPHYAKNNQIMPPAHGRWFYCNDEGTAESVFAVLNSSIFFVLFMAIGDGFHLNDSFVAEFGIADRFLEDGILAQLGRALDADLRKNAVTSRMKTRQDDEISFATFYPAKSKGVLDKIDRVLAEHYGLTEAELEFAINYDLKYRLAGGADEEEED